MRKVFYGENYGSGKKSKYILRDDAPPGKKIVGVQVSSQGPMYILTDMVKPKSNRANYSDFLQSTPWDLYYTLTPSYELSNKAARNLMSAINQHFSKCKLIWKSFYIIEPNPYRDGFHIHGVLKMNNQTTLKAMKYIFRDAYRSISQTNCFHSHDSYIVEYSDRKKGLEYICAWISHPNSDYDLIGSDFYEFKNANISVSNSIHTFV